MLENIDSKLTLFADDTSLFVKNKCHDDLEIQTFIDLNILDQWFQNNGLSINPTKSTCMEFSHPSQPQNASLLNIYINEDIIEQSREVKFLGITLDQN